MLVLFLLLLVLLFSSAISGTGLPFRLVFRAAWVHMSLPAADLRCIAQRPAEASEVSLGAFGTPWRCT